MLFFLRRFLNFYGKRLSVTEIGRICDLVPFAVPQARIRVNLRDCMIWEKMANIAHSCDNNG